MRPDHRDGERGAAAVEMGLVMPLLVLIVMGIVEYGFALTRHQIIANAAREGARAGSNQANTAAKVQDSARATVQNYLAVNGISGSSVTIDVTTPALAGTVAVQVDVSMPWPKVTGLRLLVHPDRIRSRAVMRWSQP